MFAIAAAAASLASALTLTPPRHATIRHTLVTPRHTTSDAVAADTLRFD